MSRPCEVGTLVLAKIPPSRPAPLDVRRSLPEPCASVGAAQLASGFAVLLPAADRQATLVLVGVAGTETHPAGPSTVLSWNGWLNSTVPDAKALGAATVIPTVAALINATTAAARDTTRRRKVILASYPPLPTGHPDWGAAHPWPLL